MSTLSSIGWDRKQKCSEKHIIMALLGRKHIQYFRLYSNFMVFKFINVLHIKGN